MKDNQKDYYPTYWSGCNPIHAVRDWCKVRRIIRDARRGAHIPPIIIEGDLGNGNLLTGTHRAAANDICMMLGQEPIVDYIGIEQLPATTIKRYRKAIDRGDNDLANDILASAEKRYKIN